MCSERWCKDSDFHYNRFPRLFRMLFILFHHAEESPKRTQRILIRVICVIRVQKYNLCKQTQNCTGEPNFPLIYIDFAEKDVSLPVKLAKILTLDKKRRFSFVLYTLYRIFANK